MVLLFWNEWVYFTGSFLISVLKSLDCIAWFLAYPRLAIWYSIVQKMTMIANRYFVMLRGKQQRNSWWNAGPFRRVLLAFSWHPNYSFDCSFTSEGKKKLIKTKCRWWLFHTCATLSLVFFPVDTYLPAMVTSKPIIWIKDIAKRINELIIYLCPSIIGISLKLT